MPGIGRKIASKAVGRIKPTLREAGSLDAKR